MFNTNMYNSENQEVTRQLHQICDTHPACTGCPMEHGEVIDINNQQCFCVTASMKMHKKGEA